MSPNTRTDPVSPEHPDIELARCLLKARRESLVQISASVGVSVNWLRAIAAGTNADVYANKLHALLVYLRQSGEV